jgi:predicted Na+-dependent transporter
MGDDNGGGGSSTGVVAVLVIFVIVIALAFFAYRAGWFGGKKTQVDINVTTPQK